MSHGALLAVSKKDVLETSCTSRSSCQSPSFDLDAGTLHQLAVSVDLGADKAGEFLRFAGPRFLALEHELLLDVRQVDDALDLSANLIDDRTRRPRGREYPEPRLEFVARQSCLRHRRQFGHNG